MTRGWLRNYLTAWVAGASLLIAALVNFLLHNDYPLLRLETALLAVAILIITAAVATLYVGQRQWGRSVLEGLLILLFVDLSGFPVVGAALAGLIAGLAGAWLRVPLVRPIAVFGIAVLVAKLGSSAFSPREWMHSETQQVPRSPGVATPKFAILHLLLDEQAGVHGIYPDRDGLRFRVDLASFFLSRGFAVYGRAYSEHMHTVNAVPAVLNFGTHLGRRANVNGVRIGRTLYFDRLHYEGFKIHVLQNDFADLCSDNPISICTTYDSSSLRPTLKVPLTALERTQLIGLKFMAVSKLGPLLWGRINTAGNVARAYGFGWAEFRPGDSSRTSTAAALQAADSWSHELKRARPGDAFFGHLLLPHFPQALRSDCSYLPWREWQTTRSSRSVQRRRRAYIEQDKCTLRVVDKLIRDFEQSSGGRMNVVIVHGDHGSRIFVSPPIIETAGHFGDRDVIDAHATLFAVRVLRPHPSYDETPAAIPALLSSFVESGFQTAPTPSRGTATFVLSNHLTEPQHRSEMPDNW